MRSFGALLFLTGGLIIFAPIAAVLASFFSDTSQIQNHIWTTTGPTYLKGTLVLCVMVAIIAGLTGILTAALVSLADFPGKRVLSFMLALPFAVPAYIMAYAYGDFLAPFGGLSQLMGRNTPDWALSLGIAIHSSWGAAIILSLAVYPYVYLAVRADLSSRSSAYLEAARTLGAGPFRAITRVLIPGARAALMGGLALALMETAADYGVSDYLGVPTLSTGIFKTWYGLGNLPAAAQIAASLFMITALLLLIEEAGRRGQRTEPPRAHRHQAAISLPLWGQCLAIFICALPVFLGFFVPVTVFLAKLGGTSLSTYLSSFKLAAGNSALIALIGAVLIMIASLALAFLQRVSTHPARAIFIRFMTIGYTIPGSVIAVGILLAGAVILKPLGINITTGGLILLIYAYTVRFLTAGYNVTASGFARINPLIDAAARNLGAAPSRVVTTVHLPLARRSLLAGFVIVIIDILRELPATLLLRPFNFETLATQVYRLASDERLTAAAPAALMLITAGLIPVLILSLISRETQR